MQLKKTGAGEVTFWSSEMLVTMGATGEDEATQRKERVGNHHNTHTCCLALSTAIGTTHMCAQAVQVYTMYVVNVY